MTFVIAYQKATCVKCRRCDNWRLKMTARAPATAPRSAKTIPTSSTLKFSQTLAASSHDPAYSVLNGWTIRIIPAKLMTIAIISCFRNGSLRMQSAKKGIISVFVKKMAYALLKDV